MGGDPISESEDRLPRGIPVFTGLLESLVAGAEVPVGELGGGAGPSSGRVKLQAPTAEALMTGGLWDGGGEESVRLRLSGHERPRFLGGRVKARPSAVRAPGEDESLGREGCVARRRGETSVLAQGNRALGALGTGTDTRNTRQEKRREQKKSGMIEVKYDSILLKYCH